MTVDDSPAEAPHASLASADAARRALRRRAVLVVAAVALVAVVVALFAGRASRDSSAAVPADASGGLLGGDGSGAVGRPAPAVALTRFDGGSWTPSDEAGSPLVVNFFASWCPPCVQEMPDFQRVFTEVGNRVRFVGVNTTDRIENGRELAQTTGVTYDLVQDTNGDLLAALGAVTMPVTAFIAPDGTVLEVHGGVLTADQLRGRLETHGFTAGGASTPSTTATAEVPT